MPLDRFSGEFVVKKRDEVRDEWLRDYQFRQPDADISEGSTLWLDASAAADATLPLYNDVRVIAQAIDLETASGEQLDAIGEAELGPRREASASQGYVIVTASTGGGQILQGAILRHRTTRAEYQVLVTAVYTDGQSVPVASLSTGLGTDLDEGAILEFESPPVGIGALVEVDEDGITGGGPEEDDPTYRDRIREGRRNPPAAANWAHYAAAVEAVPTIAVEKAFPYPAVRGPGTVGIIFTMRPESLGASRLPNGAQIGLVEAAVMANMPFDDGAMFGSLSAHEVNVTLEVTWSPGAPGWVDAAPWPPDADSEVTVLVVTSETEFSVSANGSPGTPTVGKTIALYDRTNKRFVAKRITAVSGSGPWDITTDDSSSTSDTTYLPVTNQQVMPWASSLPDIVDPILTYFAAQGPGEQVSPLPDPNGRRRRFPESPASWPSVITSRLIDGVDDLPVVLSASIYAPSTPFPTTVGSPGSFAYLHTLADLAVYPET